MSELTEALREESKQATFLMVRDLMQRAADELEKVELEADKLAHEAAKESARADAAEKGDQERIPPDFLNMP